MAGTLLLGGAAAPAVVPTESHQPDLAIGWNFERFDGLEQPPLVNPATEWDGDSSGFGSDYGWDRLGYYPRPGQIDQKLGQVYTPGPISGVVGTLGGQPLPVRDWKYQFDGRDGYTASTQPTVQFRTGVGQYGPSALGAAQTVALAGITNNPAQPGDLASIIAGQA